MRSAFQCWLCATLWLLPAAAAAGPWHVGARVGVVVTNIHGDLPDIASPDSKTGLQAGGFVEYAPGMLAFAIEPTYVQKGARFPFDSRLELSYLEIPALARVTLPLSSSMKPYFVLGPTFSVAIGAKLKSDAPGFEEMDYGDDLEPLDVGGTIGLGARFGQGPTLWTIEGRYSTGFNDLWDLDGNLDSINHGFGATVGVAR